MTHRDKKLDRFLEQIVTVIFRDGCKCEGTLFYKEERGRYALRKYKFTRIDGVTMTGNDNNAYLLFPKSNVKKVLRL